MSLCVNDMSCEPKDCQCYNTVQPFRRNADHTIEHCSPTGTKDNHVPRTQPQVSSELQCDTHTLSDAQYDTMLL